MCGHAVQLDLGEKTAYVSGYIIQHQPSARRHDLAQDQAEKKGRKFRYSLGPP